MNQLIHPIIKSVLRNCLCGWLFRLFLTPPLGHAKLIFRLHYMESENLGIKKLDQQSYFFRQSYRTITVSIG
ncbi:hypothetical protein C2G38_2070565 [Gigaspora rosea]|uniref:Uncharacterized protein n=1 Tax=Gigaspora rosea TaxID=44941 RepID=A0A397VQG9_9GLOM|nr:hypothetical protein C2G38_2070565 [Gigaspora rosea]